jgi:hypothetical protein
MLSRGFRFFAAPLLLVLLPVLNVGGLVAEVPLPFDMFHNDET